MVNMNKIYWNSISYSKFFDNASKYWVDDSETNLMFLRDTQKQFNEQLKSDGYLFLNDVYIALGIPRTKVGQVVGWVYNEKSTVDFGIYEDDEAILLKFNVDGNILGRIPDDRLPVV